MKRFLFIDDHAVVRSSFARVLSSPFEPVEIDEAGSGEEAIEKIKSKKFDLVIMDVQMPDTNTLDLVKFIVEHAAGTKILVLSMVPETVYAKRYLQAGANGYISKQASMQEVTKAMDAVLNNKNYMSDALVDSLIRGSLGEKQMDNPFDALSRREHEILTLLLEGKSVTDISKLLNLAMSTVGTHKTRLFEKLKVSNLIELKDLAASYNL